MTEENTLQKGMKSMRGNVGYSLRKGDREKSFSFLTSDDVAQSCLLPMLIVRASKLQAFVLLI